MKKIYIKNVKDENAITLISVVVTIVILIILTTITIKFNQGESPISDAKKQSENLSIKENKVSNDIDELYGELGINDTDPTIKVTIATTTLSITLSDINTCNLNNISEEYYDIYFNNSINPYATNKTKNDIITLNGLKDNTQYSIIIEGKTSGIKRKKIIKTNELYATDLLMKKADLSDYNSGEWTENYVSVSLATNSYTSKFYSIEGSAQNIPSRTDGINVNNDGTTKIEVSTSDGTNTAKKQYKIEIDIVAPTVSEPITSSTTNSITIAETPTDSDSGLNTSTLQYKLKTGDTWGEWQSSNEFNGLIHNTNYTIKTKVSDNVGNLAESTEITVMTKELKVGTLSMKVGSSSGADYTNDTWSSSNIYVSIATNGNYGTTTYESTTDSAQNVATGTTAPTTINTEAPSETQPSTKLKVKTTDGTNNVYSNDYVIKIDKTAPVAGTLTMSQLTL